MRIAKILNADRILSPTAGTKRGTGSWSDGCIREMLKRERYYGVFVHGETIRTRKGGKRVATKADPADVIRVDMPEWKIIDDETWNAVQEQIAARATKPWPKSDRVYALTGLARCECGGSIGISHSTGAGGERVKVYGCTYRARRGKDVCPVTVKQEQTVVDDALAEHLQAKVLTATILEAAIADVRQVVEQQLADSPTDTSAIEAELRELKQGQINLAKAVAQAPNVPALISELQKHQDRIQALEMDLAASKRTPQMLADLMSTIETVARAKMDDMRATLAADPAGAGEVYRALFPAGLSFKPTQVESEAKPVWEISGTAEVGKTTLPQVPVGALANRDPRYPLNSLP